MRIRSAATLLSLSLLIALAGANAQQWSGILAPSRAIDWSATSPGVVGGIPSASWSACVTAACKALTAAGPAATATQINAALASAPAKSVVALAAGTYSLNGGIKMAPNVVLRGAGPDKTFLIFGPRAAGALCGGEGSQICFVDWAGRGSSSPETVPGGTYAADFCGTGANTGCNSTYPSGATSVQLKNVGSSGIFNGQYIYLDQVNDNPAAPSVTNKNGLLICDNMSPTDGCSLQGGAPGRCSTGKGSGCVANGGVDRNLIQIVKVVKGCSAACKGAGPFSITITPGLYGQKWDAAHSPGAYWSTNNMYNAGVEDLTIDSTAVGNATKSAIRFQNAFNCWVSNVRSISPNRNHVWLSPAAHITVRNSYFYGTQNAQSQSYGVESFMSGDNLVVNNIFQRVTSPIMMGPSMGSVFAYNFAANDYYYVTDWMMEANAWRHDAGVLYNLSEGNLTSGYVEDYFHGTGGVNTTFRNYAVGWEAGKTQATVAVQLSSYNRFENFIGNVLGCNNDSAAYPGNCGTPLHTTYESHIGVAAKKAIFDLNPGNSQANLKSVVLPDPYVETSLMRWGNYDVVTKAVRWNASEVPSGLTDGYANPVPSSQNLPASFWLTQKPAWWGSLPWPAIGPDVKGGNVPGVDGHVYLIPAAVCYLQNMGGPVDGSGGPLAFNANSCYGPQTPARVKVAVH